MEHIEQLYYALGELCYAIAHARAEGSIQKGEKERLHLILEAEFKEHENLTDPTEIIFQVLQKEGMDSKTAYGWAIREMKLNSQYLSENLKSHFVSVILKVSEAFPPVTHEEQELISDFILQLKEMKGDPVFSHLTEQIRSNSHKE
jgi:hypothetical protein